MTSRGVKRSPKWDNSSNDKEKETLFFLHQTILKGRMVFMWMGNAHGMSLVHRDEISVCRYGRKNTLLASYITAIVFGFASAFADSYVVFAVLRFLTGFGLTGIGINSVVLSKLTM